MKDLYFVINNRKYSKMIYVIIISALLQYNLLLIYGYTNADGIIEGLYYYNNAGFALMGCGRWLLRYSQMLQGNVVIPFIKLLLYMMAIYVTSVIICELWFVSRKVSILIGIVMMTSPVMVWQMTYYFTADTFAGGCLFSSLFVYLIFNSKGIKDDILATLALSLSLGLYQSYIGMAALLVLMTAVVWRLRQDNTIFKLVGIMTKGLVEAALAAVIYFITLKIETKHYSVSLGGRANAFSICTSIKSLPETVINSYKEMIRYFFDSQFVLSLEKRLNLLIFVLLFSAIFLILVTRFEKKQRIYSFIFVLCCGLLFPIAAESAYIFFPSNGVTYQMQYQMILFYPFLLTLIEVAQFKKKIIQNSIVLTTRLCIVCLVWIWIIRGNATFRCYELSYRYLNNEMSMVLDDVYHTEEYEKNITPIVFGGYIHDDVLRRSNRLYQYAITFPDNVAFWQNIQGATTNRKLYLLNYFGVDGKDISNEVYEAIINSEEYNLMPVWPKTGAISMIDDCIVVKFEE